MSEINQLPAIGFLADLDEADRAFLAGYGRFLRVSTGGVVIREGAEQDSLYLVLSGILHVTSEAGGRPILVAALGAGDALGEVNLFDPDTASATVLAKSDCVIWKLTGNELDGCFEADPAVALRLMKGLLRLAASRLRAMNRKLAGSEEKAAFHEFWKAGE